MPVSRLKSVVPFKTTKKPTERIKMVVGWDIATNTLVSQKIETGISKLNPGIWVVKSCLVYADQIQHAVASSSFALSSDEESPFVLEDNARANLVDGKEDVFMLGKARSQAGASQESPLVVMDMSNGSAIFEEELWFHVQSVGTATIGKAIIEFESYKVTEKQWYDTAVNSTTDERFI